MLFWSNKTPVAIAVSGFTKDNNPIVTPVKTGVQSKQDLDSR
ncbi:MAG: hypothetical protein QOF64_822 [Candidatus Binatota bacterium]|nr:hypothetical protein [Candidatus Binatota bacterium]